MPTELLSRNLLDEDHTGLPRYEIIANALQRSMEAGDLRAGDRLPTVRQLSESLGVSGATVSAAYALLADRGCTKGEVGRGTFVAEAEPPGDGAAQSRTAGPQFPAPRGRGWRSGALAATSARLRAAAGPSELTIDCASGTPDPALLPSKVVRRALRDVAARLAAEDLQYASPVCAPELAPHLLRLLASEDVLVDENDLVVASNAMQLLEMSLRALSTAGEAPVVGVEEPGYALAFDLVEQLGGRTVPVAVDNRGATPAALAAAAAQGATLALLTPRAQSPTGASWDEDRARRLASVLRDAPALVVVEDDHFASLCQTPSRSLRRHADLRDQVIYMRSFSKTIAPDMRVAVAAAPVRLARRMLEEKLTFDGWTSRLLQRTLASVLESKELPAALNAARCEYAGRRAALVEALLPLEANGALKSVARPQDGLSVFVTLPDGVRADAVADAAARAGLLVTPAEPFHHRPGDNRHVRLSIGAFDPTRADLVASRLAEALAAGGRGAPLTHAV